MDAIREEIDEALRRSPSEDYGQFMTVCGDIRSRLGKMHALRKAGRKSGFNEMKDEVVLLFLQLKKLNRLDKLRIKDTRDNLTEQRSKVDNIHLQLQNLLYEVLYLKKEISKCHEFKSADESLDIVERDQFFREAPSKLIQSLGESPYDEHRLTLARLDWELERRKELTKTTKDKLKVKEKICLDIGAAKDKLNSIRPILSNVVESFQPLIRQFGSPTSLIKDNHPNCEYLSHPMYNIYVNICAMSVPIEIKIDGNIEEAKVLQTQNPRLSPLDIEDFSEQDGDDRKGKRHRKSRSSQKKDNQKRIIQPHPLSLHLIFHLDNPKIELKIEFFHIIHLGIITVKVYLNMSQENHQSDILNAEILSNLFPGDDGLRSPNPNNDYLLESLKLEKFDQLIPKIGRPFKWAQALGGLSFMSREPGELDTVKTFCSVIQKIKRRFSSRISLHQTMSDLENGIITLPPKLMSVVFPKLCCVIKEWKSSSIKEWRAYESGREMMEQDIIDENEFLFFKLIIERGSAHLKALVAIPCDYPDQPPIFQLIWSWQSEKTSISDCSIRNLECHINTKVPSDLDNEHEFQILALQVQKLCVAFDSLLEVEQKYSGAEGPLEFQVGRMFPRLVRGRDHSRPFLYDHENSVFK
ncbi:THO complex subunit 5 [Brevipalpus obovatus]|uniref:THO complex subunit 5 n=1 Tax=Brevipalpus obovatus TaxID=246614 RepID=UPI003D9F8848